MDIQTESKGEFNLPSQNYAVAAVQRQIFGRSNIAGIFVNRQDYANSKFSNNSFNRIAGLDFNLASNNNLWSGKAFYHQAFTPIQLKNSSSNATYLMYSGRFFTGVWNHEYVGENYIADVGFVPRLYNRDDLHKIVLRKTYWRLEPSVGYKFYPHSKIINNHGPTLHYDNYFDEKYKSTDRLIEFTYALNFVNTAIISFKITDNTVRFRYPIDLLGNKALLDTGKYHFNNFVAFYTSNKRKKLNGLLNFEYGSFYSGTRFSSSGEINWRRQPWGIFSLAYSYDKIYLPSPLKNSELTLIGPKFEFAFTKSIFFTTFIQYNTQIENVNINARLQWRYRPLSDFYIVYTDNYYSTDFTKKNRAVVVKFIYWLTL